MARIEQGYYTVERVPEGTRETRYIYDNGEYPVVDTSNGKDVFEGGFDHDDFDGFIVSPEWLAKLPNHREFYTLRRFKLIKQH